MEKREERKVTNAEFSLGYPLHSGRHTEAWLKSRIPLADRLCYRSQKGGGAQSRILDHRRGRGLRLLS